MARNVDWQSEERLFYAGFDVAGRSVKEEANNWSLKLLNVARFQAAAEVRKSIRGHFHQKPYLVFLLPIRLICMHASTDPQQDGDIDFPRYVEAHSNNLGIALQGHNEVRGAFKHLVKSVLLRPSAPNVNLSGVSLHLSVVAVVTSYPYEQNRGYLGEYLSALVDVCRHKYSNHTKSVSLLQEGATVELNKAIALLGSVLPGVTRVRADIAFNAQDYDTAVR